MSTTTSREVAAGYARGARGDAHEFPIVFRMEQGMISRGADLAFLSQYPFEEEGADVPPLCLACAKVSE